ncbi:MAG: hypothetical protein WDO68_11550 [Gammaproteobacteria bacterium]
MTIQWIRGIRAAVTISLLLTLAACASSRAQFPVQQYVPTTRELLPLGQLHLSNTLLQFAALEGQMKLQYAGIMPDSAGPDIAGATVYRVKNAEGFFKKNAGKEAFCSKMPLWVAVSSESGAPAWSKEIWVGLLTLEDWASFKHADDYVCLGGDYVRTAG